MRTLGRAVQRGERRAGRSFTSSIEIDRELAADDIAGSIAHVRGLGRAGLLTDDEVDELVDGLAALAEDVAAGPLRLGPRPRGRPPEPRGRPGRAGRAGRRPAPHRPLAQRPGRHGPAALDAPGDRPPRCRARRLRARAGRPRRARRDGRPPRHDPHPARPARAVRATTCSPMSRWPSATAAGLPTRAAGSTSRRSGAGALAGAGYPLDREATAAELGFDGVTANSLDAVSDRDFVVEALAAVALGMVHLSRLAEEITWWSNPRFGFVRVVRRVLDRQLDHAQQEEPRSGRAGPRPRRPRHRGADRGRSRCSRACRWPTSATSRRTRRRCSTRSRSTRRRSACSPGCSTTLTVDRERMRAAAAEGYTTATAVADSAGPARRPVPGRPPRRRLARGPGRGGGRRPRRGRRRDDRAGARGERRPGRRRRLAEDPGSATRSARRPRSTARSRPATSSAGPRRPGSRRRSQAARARLARRV